MSINIIILDFFCYFNSHEDYYIFRDWECYKDLDEPRETDVVTDIAYQLIHNEPGNKMKVMMGGGRPAFFLKKEDEQPKPKDSDYDNYTWDCYSNE